MATRLAVPAMASGLCRCDGDVSAQPGAVLWSCR
jgi:hypothetical protein